MEIIIVTAVFFTAATACRIGRYYADKNKKKLLLTQVINREVNFSKVWITEPDINGYQKLKISLIQNGKSSSETLACHFDIPQVSAQLCNSDIRYMGCYQK